MPRVTTGSSETCRVQSGGSVLICAYVAFESRIYR